MSGDIIRNILRIVALFALIIILIWFFGSITWVLGLFVFSLFFVYALIPIVEYFKKRFNMPHGISVGLAFFIFLSFIIIFLIFIVPVAIQEIKLIINDFPRYFVQIQILTIELEQWLETLDFDPGYFYLENLPQQLKDLQPTLESIASMGLDLVAWLANILLIILIVFYLLYDFHKIRSNIISLCPEKYRQVTQDIIQIIDRSFGGYVRGTIIRLFIVGFVVGGTMYIIGMPYAFLLGLFAGVMDIFPYIGPYIAVVPALFISLSPNAPSIILVIIIYAIVQALESFVLSPLLLGKAVKIKPITVLVCMLTGQQVAGIIGMVLFVPLAGIIKSLIIYFQEKQGTPKDRMIT